MKHDYMSQLCLLVDAAEVVLRIEMATKAQSEADRRTQFSKTIGIIFRTYHVTYCTHTFALRAVQKSVKFVNFGKPCKMRTSIFFCKIRPRYSGERACQKYGRLRHANMRMSFIPCHFNTLMRIRPPGSNLHVSRIDQKTASVKMVAVFSIAYNSITTVAESDRRPRAAAS